VSAENHSLRSRLRELYYGHTDLALRYQAILFVLDLAVVGFFIFNQFIEHGPWFWVVDICIAVFLALDMLAKLYALGTVRRWLRYPSTWADIIVLATFAMPQYNLGFLRILRLWSLVQSERFWNVLARGRFDDTYTEDLTKAVVTLVTFILLGAGFAQALFLGQHPKLNNFVDALYFVVTSLTTTGYGDITIDTAAGRIFSVALMLAGISLFFSIAQKVFAPPQKIAPCASCGLDRHELDAKHCKICGGELPAPLRGRARRGKAAPSKYGKGA
jgi:voltage-gated potassium channel